LHLFVNSSLTEKNISDFSNTKNKSILSLETIPWIYFLIIFTYIKFILLFFFSYILCLNRSIRNIIYTLCYQNNKGNDKKKRRKKEAHSHKFIWDTQRKKKRKEYCLFFLQTYTHWVFFLDLRCYFFFSYYIHRISKEEKERRQFYIWVFFFVIRKSDRCVNNIT